MENTSRPAVIRGHDDSFQRLLPFGESLSRLRRSKNRAYFLALPGVNQIDLKTKRAIPVHMYVRNETPGMALSSRLREISIKGVAHCFSRPPSRSTVSR